MCVPLCNVVHFVDSIHQESERRIEKDFDFHVSFVHTRTAKSSAPNLAYISLCLHVALRACLPKSPSSTSVTVVVDVVVLSFYSTCAMCNIWMEYFCMKIRFSVHFLLLLPLPPAPSRHVYAFFFIPSTSPPHILSLCVFLHPIFKVRWLVYIVPAVYENIHVYKIDPLLDNNKLKTKSDRNST